MKLLILSPDAYSVFHTDTSYIFGGIEIETGYHARGLAKMGVDVFVVTRDQGREAHLCEGVHLLPHPRLKGEGYWEKRRSFGGRIQYRLFGDRGKFSTADELYDHIAPDACYVMGMAPETLHLARYCRRKNCVFIFRIAHDLDLGDETFDAEKMKAWAGVSPAEVREVIETAAEVLVQTPFQREMLEKRFGRSGEMMFPPIPTDVPQDGVAKEYDVLWVGKSNTFKRPEKLAGMARRMPGAKFCMVFNKVNALQWEEVRSQLGPNVTLLESVPADRI
ncbi:MAG TPA: hypothetical protein VFU15_08400, partial [Bacteroidia bacterium]|nr:hypothetical protein [Bacteroidia bacterium]